MGVTQAVKGAIVLGSDGEVLADRSKITIDLATLRSDEARRDNYVRQNTLATSRYPQAIFVPRRITGLPSPVPAEGEAAFQITGDMTVHGVTKSITWDVTAAFNRSLVDAHATTHFTFGDFGMAVPRVFVVLSVEDNIRLEADFHLEQRAADT